MEDLPDIDDYKDIITSWRDKHARENASLKELLNAKAIAAISAQVLREVTEKWSKRRLKDFKEDLLYVNMTPINPPKAPELEKKLQENKSRCRYTEKPVKNEAQLLKEFQVKQEQMDIGFDEIEAEDDDSEDIEDTESEGSISSNEFESIIAECISEYEDEVDELDPNQPSTSTAVASHIIPKEESSDEWSAPEDNSKASNGLPIKTETREESSDEWSEDEKDVEPSTSSPQKVVDNKQNDNPLLTKRTIQIAQRPSDSSDDSSESSEDNPKISDYMNKKVAAFFGNEQPPGSSVLDLLQSSQSSGEEATFLDEFSDDDLPLNDLAVALDDKLKKREQSGADEIQPSSSAFSKKDKIEKAEGNSAKKVIGAIVISDSDDDENQKQPVKKKVRKSRSSLKNNAFELKNQLESSEDEPVPPLIYDGGQGIPKVYPRFGSSKITSAKRLNGIASSHGQRQKSTLEMLESSNDEETFMSSSTSSKRANVKEFPNNHLTKKPNQSIVNQAEPKKSPQPATFFDKLCGKRESQARTNTDVLMEFARMADENERIRTVQGNARVPEAKAPQTVIKNTSEMTRAPPQFSQKSSKNPLRPNNNLPLGQKRRIQTTVRPLDASRKRPSTPPPREPPARRPGQPLSEVISLLSDSE